jgi:hypothetical protein
MDELKTLARHDIGHEMKELHPGEVFATITPSAISDCPDMAMYATLKVRVSS